VNSQLLVGCRFVEQSALEPSLNFLDTAHYDLGPELYPGPRVGLRERAEALKRNRFEGTLKLPLLAIELPAAQRCEAWLKMPSSQRMKHLHSAGAPALRIKMMIL
jgi:hypothetical protein